MVLFDDWGILDDVLILCLCSTHEGGACVDRVWHHYGHDEG
jgi:hypothetical protein